MSDQTEMCFCRSCRVETLHVVVLVRKPSGFENAKNRERKEFIAGFIKGWLAGPFLASMDEFSRHVICERCGTTIIEE
jgi:ribosomal protein L37E